MATVMDESKLQPISVLCICSVYYCGEDTEETGERHQVIMLGQHTGHWPPDTGHVHTVASGDQGRVGRWTPVVATPMSMSPPPRHAVCTRSGLRDDTRSGGDILTTFLFLSRL